MPRFERNAEKRLRCGTIARSLQRIQGLRGQTEGISQGKTDPHLAVVDTQNPSVHYGDSLRAARLVWFTRGK